MDGIRGADAVYGGLGGDGPPASVAVQGVQLGSDERGFGTQGGGFGPGDLVGRVAGEVGDEEAGDVC